MNYVERMVSYAMEELKKELHDVELKKAEEFFFKKFDTKEFHKQKVEMSEKLEEKGYGEKEDLILNLMMMGLGRNRTCEALSYFSVGRKEVETVRDICGFRDSEERKENEKYITALKWKTKKRAKHLKLISIDSWEKIKKEYDSGESPQKIGVKYGVSGHIISQRLKEEGLFDELRSTITKNKLAEEKIKEIDNDLIVKIMEENETEPVSNIWRITQSHYPWLLRRQFLEKLKELNLERTEEEVSFLKQEKSKPSSDNSFEIKSYIINAVNEVYGSVDKMTEIYLNNELNSYRDIAEEVNKKNPMKISVSERQIYRLISNTANFRRQKSSQQDDLYKKLVNLFPEIDILEEVNFAENNKRVDIYIPELKLAIEFNGDYWHSDTIIQKNYGVSAFTHHKERAETLKDEGVKLIYIWSSDWNKNSEEVLRIIKSKDWNHPLLNQYESPTNNKGSSKLHKELVQSQIIKLLKESGYEDFKVKEDKMEIEFK